MDEYTIAKCYMKESNALKFLNITRKNHFKKIMDFDGHIINKNEEILYDVCAFFFETQGEYNYNNGCDFYHLDKIKNGYKFCKM